MRIQFRDLASKGNVVRFQERIDVTSLISGRRDITGIGPVEADLSVRVVDGIADIDGRIKADVELVCSRCLNPVKESLDIPFHEQFKQVSELSDEEEDEDDVIEIADEQFDLRPFVEESVLMNLPFVPLCDEACLGLCPECGQNRNEQSCGCKSEKIDPRLAGLQDFFKSE